MPDLSSYKTRLVDVWKMNYKEFSQDFIDYDTTHTDGYYELPKTDVLVILLKTSHSLWTTVRRWTPQKEKYYRSLIGQDVKIEICSLQPKKEGR